MPRPRRQDVLLLPLAAALTLIATPTATAERAAPAGVVPRQLHVPRATIPLREYAPGLLRSQARPTGVAAPLGTVRTWLALDETVDRFVPVPFRLAGAGEHVEVWVATSLTFPAGDCRNGVDNGGRVTITPEHASYLVQTFDRTIYPRLSSAFSVPPSRDGTRARANPSQYDSRGDGDDVVVLVDNIRDSNFYDRDNRGNEPYIAGFFSEDLVEFFDRNVLTVDAYDWTHRSGATPPHNPVPGDLCASAPARPYQYEATLAHEYHHLLELYEDPDEALWVDEGLADVAQRVTGFVDPRRTIQDVGYDSHVQCFLGWLAVQTDANPNPRRGGPENSLTGWGDHSGEILCDYGAAFSFMEFLAGRYGARFIRELHRDDRRGIQGLASVVRRLRVPVGVAELVRDWAATAALDDVLDRGARLARGSSRYRTATLRASVNWDNPRTYDALGAPPNGSDFVRLRNAEGGFLHARDLRSVRFTAPVGSFSLQLLAYRAAGGPRAYLARVPLRARRGGLGPAALRHALGTGADVVAAVVTAHDPSGEARAYSRYRLTVNGVLQPGG